MNNGVHWVHGAIVAIALAAALIAGLAVIDPALGAVVAIIVIGWSVIVIPLVSIHYDRHQGPPLHR